MRIGELAEHVGMSRDTIRFYEREGLITPARGDQGRHGYRRYDEAAVRRMGLIKQAKALGFSLEEIREILEAWASHALTPDEKRAVLDKKISVVDKRIAELQNLSDELRRIRDAIGVNCP